MREPVPEVNSRTGSEVQEWRTRAKQGDRNAQTNLGHAYYWGDGVSKDLEQALYWYGLAADQGDRQAQFNIGRMYLEGEGVQADDDEAIKWFERAAENGYVIAQEVLGQFYYDGRGADKDYAKARYWWQRAEQNGSSDAADWLKTLSVQPDNQIQETKISSESINQDVRRRTYIQDLREKYGNQVTATSAAAWQAVDAFLIDCRAPDHRVLPLMTLLYASAAEIDRMGGELRYTLLSNGREVRIYETAYKNGKELSEPRLKFEINSWGELRPFGIRPEAVLNACFGSYGPIWEFARKGE